MMTNELKPCPMCNSADNIHLYRGYPNILYRYECGCDCGFFAPRAITIRGAKRRWNRYVTAWKKGYEVSLPSIMAELERELERMADNE